MKRNNKIFIFVLLMLCLIIAGCETTPIATDYTITFDSNGGTDVTSQTVKSGEKVTKPTNPTYVTTEITYEFYGWYNDNVPYDFNLEVKSNLTLTAKWGGLTPKTDALKLTASYEGKDFIKDGIGEVTLFRSVDGDTSMFRNKNGETFTVRYLGINAPESTYRIEPWGFAASNYVKKTLNEHIKNGGKIVLQAEDLTTRFDSTGTRYLGWVWLINTNGDSRLLNLQTAELAYAQVKGASETQYYQYFLDAIAPLGIAKVKVYGQVDPSYDYSRTGTPMTIREIREEYGTPEQVEAYSAGGETTTTAGELIVSGAGTKVIVSGTVIRKNGERNAYIQQYDEESNTYYGIYVYGGYNAISKLMIGYDVEITAKIGYYYGSLQLTDLTSDSNIKIWSASNNSVSEEKRPEDISIDKYTEIGKLVEIKNLTVTGYNDSDNNNSFTIYTSYVASNGKTQNFQIRVDAGTVLYDSENQQIKSGEYFVGKTIESITGIISYYNGATSNINYESGRIQLMLTDFNDVTFK